MLTRSKASSVYCGICFTTCNDTIGRIQCCHVYCSECIEKWALMKNTCPNCRAKISSIQRLPVDLSPFKGNIYRLIYPETIAVKEPEK